MAARDFDGVVVGGGIVGLACAAELARRGRSVLIVERASGVATGITARNSEVIHAGIYDPPGSLKAELCVAGQRMLYERCARLGIPHRRVGKWIVATEAEDLRVLEELQVRGSENGAEGLEIVDAAAVQKAVPGVRALAALYSPSSGIIDTREWALSYLAEAEAHGAVLLLRSEVVALDRAGDDWRVLVTSADGASHRLRCAVVVNAAGLDADRVAALAGLDIDALGYRIHYCKGHYFSLAPGHPLRLPSLLYPVPSQAGLGIHASFDLAGRIRFGPDVEYVEQPDYRVDPLRARAFATAVQRYLPEIDADALVPEGAGIRPKRAAPGEGFRDFLVREEGDRGAFGLVNCIGIESPGLTAAPALALRVADLLELR